MTEPDCDPIPPDPPRSPGTPELPDLDVDIERFNRTPEALKTQDVNPDAASPEPPD